jgi:hypothetical protein
MLLIFSTIGRSLFKRGFSRTLDMMGRGLIALVGRFPRVWYEDNLSNFPLCREVPFEQDCTEELGYRGTEFQ